MMIKNIYLTSGGDVERECYEPSPNDDIGPGFEDEPTANADPTQGTNAQAEPTAPSEEGECGQTLDDLPRDCGPR